MHRARHSYRGRGGRGIVKAATSSGKVQAVKTNGLFERGVWLCDCDPRLPGVHYEVKKEGPTQGQWFYTCQQQDLKRCGFYLWDDQAKLRMESAILNNSTSEPIAAPAHPTPAMNKGSTKPAPVTPAKSPTTKRKLPWVQYDEEESDAEVYPWPLTGMEEQTLSQAVDEAASHSGPRKAVKRDEFSTATGAAKKVSSSSDRKHGLITPGSTASKPLVQKILRFTSPTPARPNELSDKNEDELETSPAQLHFENIEAGTAEENQGAGLTDSVFDLLKTAKVDLQATTVEKLRALLKGHEMQKLGVEKGREIARVGLKSRDAKLKSCDATIVHQAEKIMLLEDELEASKALVRYLRQS